jgi:hypothetical protein
VAPPDTRQGIPSRVLVLTLFALGVLGASSRYWPAESGAAAALAILTASLALVLVPGALVALAWRPETEPALFDVLGAGLAVSLVLVQLGVVAAIVFHLPIGAVAIALGVVASAHGIVAARAQSVVVQVSLAEGLFGVSLVVVGAFLYMVGSPIDSTEDAIHIGIVRRLTHLAAPSLENLYVVPGVPYTYPFPGTHYVMALVSHVSGLDPLFVYHKLRVAWGPAALVLLYACARRVFENRAQALASGAIAAMLVLNGSFAGVPGFYWGQLAPYSHASDVAMGVLLPALLLSALQAQQAPSRRALIWFTTVSAGLVVTLTMTHIREVVQFVAYMGAFTLALLMTKAPRRDVARAGMLLLLGLVAPLVYEAWHARAVPDIDAAVDRHRQALVAIAGQLSLGNWLQPTNQIISGYTPAFDALFHGWNPVVLLGGPALVMATRTPGMLLIGSSVLAFALVLRVGALGWAYVYATYFEILYTPARNTIFFVHLMAGALVYAVCVALARRRPLTAAAATVVVTAGLVFGYTALPKTLASRTDLLWVPLLLGYAAAIAVGRLGRHPVVGVPPSRSRAATTAVATTIVGAVFLVSGNATTSPLVWEWAGVSHTPAALLAGLDCRRLDDYEVPYGPADQPPLRVPTLISCPPPLDLIRFAASALPAEAILATDKFDEYAPPMFMPQQVIAWPGRGDGLLDQRALFRPYFRFFDASIRTRRDQPFFNGSDTEAERRAFLDGLRVTHVLVSPRVRQVVIEALMSSPDRYRSRFDNGQWAVFEVVR